MASTIASFSGLMYQKFTDPDMVDPLIYPDNVLMGLLRKDTSMVGTDLKVPIIYGVGQGVGADVTQAIANASNIKDLAFEIDAGDYFGIVDIGDKVIKASRNNKGAALQNKEAEIEGMTQQMGENLSLYTWGNGGYAIGKVAAINGDDITLEYASDIQNFEVDMAVRESANDGSDSSHTIGTGTTTVTAINPSTGVITLDSAATLTGLAVGHYLFRDSDFFGTSGKVVIKGVRCFVTDTDTPMDLWGVTQATRLTSLARLAGFRLGSTDYTGLDIEERIKKLHAVHVTRAKGQRADSGFLNPEDFDKLDTAMAAKGQRSFEDDSTKFGYQRIDVQTPAGKVKIYSDRHTKRGDYFGLRLENLWLSSMGPLIHPMEEDGLVILRVSGTTNYRYTGLSYPLLACNAPKNLCRTPLPA